MTIKPNTLVRIRPGTVESERWGILPADQGIALGIKPDYDDVEEGPAWDVLWFRPGIVEWFYEETLEVVDA